MMLGVESVVSIALALSLGATSDFFPFAAEEAELSVDIGVHELKAHVYRLASREFMGRKGPGAARAARHIAAAFERLQLEPAFGNSFYQEIPWLVGSEPGGAASFLGRNVAAVLPGSDPRCRDEWIILSAHYDHLGIRGGVMYPGADDNASGVAMLLEVAERFALQKLKPRRTIVFVAFDQEEAGLIGSRHFVLHPPRDFKKLKAFLTADMLGRAMANVMDDYVFALGSECSSGLRRLLGEVRPEPGLNVGRLGADLVGTRSDYGPFRDRGIPFLFFSTGQHPDYHRPTDLPERIDYVRLRKIAMLIGDLAWRLANDAEAPVWDDRPAADLEEVYTILTLVSRVLANPRACPLGEHQRSLVSSVEERLTEIAERGEITESERSWLVWTARVLLLTVF
jgi:hypothetical protein